jgi:MYXO-CTERM domain-containing protein
MSRHALPPVSTARTARRLALSLGLGLGVFGTTNVASAWPEFPSYIQNILELNCAPTCLLCHTSPEGGKENIKQGSGALGPPGRGFEVFVQNLISQSAPNSIAGPITSTPPESALAAAIEALRTKPCNKTMDAADTACDSDGDLTPDVLELQGLEDPDDPVDGSALCVGPRYGCGAHVAPTPPPARGIPNTGALVAALGVALLLARRFRS